MIIAILIITIFNTGLIILMSGAVLMDLKRHTADTAKVINDNTDKDIEALGTAIFNMESLKQKAEMGGKAEL